MKKEEKEGKRSQRRNKRHLNNRRKMKNKQIYYP